MPCAAISGFRSDIADTHLEAMLYIYYIVRTRGKAIIGMALRAIKIRNIQHFCCKSSEDSLVL